MVLLSFVRYALRSKKILRKLGLGLLLFYWRNHIFQLGNYAGMFYALKGNINGLLQIQNGLNSKYLLSHFLTQMEQSNTEFSKSDYYNFVFKTESISETNSSNLQKRRKKRLFRDPSRPIFPLLKRTSNKRQLPPKQPKIGLFRLFPEQVHFPQLGPLVGPSLARKKKLKTRLVMVVVDNEEVPEK